MASDNEASCINDPNFAVICGFLEKFGVLCGVTGPDFMELQEMLENTHEVPPALIDLHIKLLRKVRRSVSRDRWERVLIKVCHIYCTQDAWELERFGYKKARLTSKLRILKNLCEMQFDLNQKFKTEVNRQTANELRSEPIGRDKFGHSYWYQIDENCQLRVYREDPDEETWTLVARDREGLVRLIQQLADGDVGELVLNEDSNSLEIEKPITDTGQISSSVSTCEAEAEAEVDADADASTTGNEDSKESVASELKADVASSNESDNKIAQPEPEHLSKENDLKITINKSNIIPVKNLETDETENNKNVSITISSNFKGTDVLSKKKKSINELAENLTKYKSTDIPNKPIIQEHHFHHQQQLQQQQQQQQQLPQLPQLSQLPQIPQQQQQQEREMDLSMKKPSIKVKHFASLSEPPIDFGKSDDDDDDDVDDDDVDDEDDDDDDSYESDEIKLPSHMKQPRLGRPTLLGNAKKKTYSDEDDEDDDVDDEEEEEDEYGEPIEEPVMLIRGEGSGRECKNENTNFNIEFSDVIEESVIYFYGEGSGRDCTTGNTSKEGDSSTSPEKEDATRKGSSLTPAEEQSTRTLHCASDSDENIISQSESVLDDLKTHKIGTVMIDVKSVDRIQVIPDVVQLKKVSRWDVGKPNECATIEKPSTNISINNERNVEATNSKDLNLPKPTAVSPKQSVFFFGPQADCFKFSSPISTHFQCTKPPPSSKISNTDIKDEKPENASVKKSENVPTIEKKSEILVVKEQSTENTLYNIDDLKKEQLESIDSSKNTSKNLEKQHSVEEENTTKISKDLKSDVKGEVPSRIESLNKKLDDDDTADDKSETLSETLDSLETLIENDDTTLNVDDEKSQLPEKDKSNVKEVVVDSKKYDLKPSASDVPQNTSTNDTLKQTQIDEATKPVDNKTQIDEISSSDNDKCEVHTTEKNVVPKIDETISMQQVKSSQDTEIISSEKNASVKQHESTEQSPSACVTTCDETNIESTSSKIIESAENKSSLEDPVAITESTKMVDLQSASGPNTLESTVVQNKVNLEETLGNENTLSSSSDKQTELSLCDKHLDIKSPVEINKEEEESLKPTKDICLKKPELTKKSNENNIIEANIETVSNNFQLPEMNIKQSAIEDNILSKNILSTSDKSMEQSTTENSTKMTDDNLKTETPTVSKDESEQTLRISETTSEVNENLIESNSNKRTVITEIIINSETLIENIPAQSSKANLIKKIPEKSVTADNNSNPTEDISDTILEQKSVESETESNELLNKSEIVSENISKQNLDKSNIENRSGTKIIIADKTTFEINPSTNSIKTRSETTNKIENISEENLDVKTIETQIDDSSPSKIENPVEKISKQNATVKTTESTSETKFVIIDKIEKTTEKTLEQISVVESSKNKIEFKTAETTSNVLENLVDTCKENVLKPIDKNTSLTNLAVDSKNVIKAENENFVNRVENDSETKVDSKIEEKNVSVKIISKHEENDNEKNLKSIPSRPVANTQNVDEKDLQISDMIENTDQDNQIDDSQRVVEEKTVFHKEKLTNKEQSNIENEIPLKKSKISKETSKNIRIEEENKFESHDATVHFKEDLRQENKDLILKSSNKNKEKSEESDVPCSAQTPEIATDKDRPLITEVTETFKNNETQDKKGTEIIEDKETAIDPKTSVEILDDFKSKNISEAFIEINVKSDAENFPKDKNLSLKVAKSNQERNAVESQKPELICNVQSIEINKENKSTSKENISDINSIEKNIERQDNNINIPEVQIKKIHQKTIPEVLENIASSNTDTIEKLDISLQSIEEPCKKETAILLYTQDRNALSSDIEESKVKNNESEIVSNLESSENINLKTTSICPNETPNLEVTKEKDEQVCSKIDEAEDLSKSSTIQKMNKKQILETVKDKNDQMSTSIVNDTLVVNCGNVAPKIDFEKHCLKDEEIKTTLVATSTIDIEKNDKKEKETKLTLAEENKKDEAKVSSVAIPTIDPEKIDKKDEANTNPISLSTIDSKKDTEAKVTPVSIPVIGPEKNTKKYEAKLTSVVISTIDLEKIGKTEEVNATTVAISKIDSIKDCNKDEEAKVASVTISTIDSEKVGQKYEETKISSITISPINLEKISNKDEAKVTPVTISTIDSEKIGKKEQEAKVNPVTISTLHSEKICKKEHETKVTPVTISTINPEKNSKKEQEAKVTSVTISTIDPEKYSEKDKEAKESSVSISTKHPKKISKKYEEAKVSSVTISTINPEKISKKDEAKLIPVSTSIINPERISHKDEEAKVSSVPISTINPEKISKKYEAKVTPVIVSTIDPERISQKDEEAKVSSVTISTIDPKKVGKKEQEANVTPVIIPTIDSKEISKKEHETKITSVTISTINSEDISKKENETKVTSVTKDSEEISKKDEETKVIPVNEAPSKISDKIEKSKAAIDKNNASNVETDSENKVSVNVANLTESIEIEESSDDDMVHDSYEQGNQYSDESNDEEAKNEAQNEVLQLPDISIVKKSESKSDAENIDLKNISLIKNVKSNDVDQTIRLSPSISIKPVKPLVSKFESQIDDDVKKKLLNSGITLTRVIKDKDVITSTTLESSNQVSIESEEKPKLMCIDISKLKASSEESTEPIKLDEPIKIDNEDDVIDVPETDPLAIPDEEIVLKKEEEPPVKTLSLATFKLDDTDESIDPTASLPAPIARALRNRKIALNIEPVKKTRKENSKTAKPKVKNNSEDEGSKNMPEAPPKMTKPQTARRGRGRSTGMAREVTQNTPELNDNSSSISCDVQSETANTDKKSISIEAEQEMTKTVTNDEVSSPPPKRNVKKKSRILGLDIDPSAIIELKSDDETPTTRSSVRQSRRIAQLKIREEAMQRKVDDIQTTDGTFKKKKKSKKDDDKEFKVDKKNKKQKVTTDEDDSDEEVVDEVKRKHKKKRKHQDLKKLFNMEHPWQSSSNDSSTQNEEEEEDEVEEELTEDEAVLKSDHEFSPESDLENSSEVQPLRRARTVKKESDTEDPTDEHACQKCSKADHPEWILLCDKCDCGWHCSCLRPALLVIPEGDWFCPPCQHIALIEALKTQLTEYDKKMNRLEMEVRRKERLAYVGISLNNVLPAMKEHEPQKEKEKEKERRHHEEHSNESADSSSESDESNSESSSDEDSEPIYQLRQRRQAQTYRFNDYDELINSAIQDEIEAVKGAGNQGRGKDIATIVNAEKEEAKALLEQQHNEQQQPQLQPEQQQQQQQQQQDQQQQQQQQPQPQPENQSVEQSAVHEPPPPAPPPPVVPVNKEKEEHESEDDSEDELRVVPKHSGKKKHRKLNALDVSSEDDNADDEDFKGTSDDEEEEFEDLPSEDSEDMEIGRRGKGRHGPIRRSTRARTQRYDRDFINDDSDAEEDSRRKKKRSIWDESESEESDKDWGRKKRSKKQRHSSSVIRTSNKKSRKRKKRRDDSDPEADVKRSFKKSRIKYGGLSDSDDELLTRRTRGKKINYIDALGSDSDDEKPKPKRIIESEDEYVANEDDDEDQEQEEPLLDDDKDESDSEDENNPNKPVVKIPKGRGKAGLHRIIKTSEATMPPVFMKKMETETSEGVSKLSTSTIPENIPVIAANPENLNEEEVETMMMESEEYANKQLELMAIQLAKEKQKRVLDNQLNIQLLNKPEQQMVTEVRQPKKRGRKRKVDIEAAAALAAAAAAAAQQNVPSSIIVNTAASNQNTIMAGGGVGVGVGVIMDAMKQDADILPTVVTELQTTPTKRRGRGKGKKTLEKEAAASGVDVMTAAEPMKSIAVSGTIIPPANTITPPTQIEQSNEAPPQMPIPIPIPETSILAGKLGIAAPPQPFSQSQPTPSVITRMLQSQPISVQSFPSTGPNPNQMNQKYFPGMHDQPPRNAPPPPPPQFAPMSGGRNRVPSPYRQPSPNITIFPGMRPGPANSPHRLRGAGPPPIQQMFHSTHHSLDPSPSGGGPINISQATREGNSPQMITPPVSSPMAKDGPPPPAYNRAQIPVNRFSPGENSPGPSIPSPIRHHIFSQAGAAHMPPQSSPPPPPPSRPPPPSGNFSPYHPPPPPNYHYGAYPPAPSLAAADDALPPTDYQGSPYPEPYNTTDGTIQSSEGSNSKPFDEEGSGEFGGLVSYFSSQREDDLDT